MALTSISETIATIFVISSIAVGFWNASSSLGGVSDVVGKAIDQPQTFGTYLALYFVALDTWVPTVPPELLANYSLGWLSIFYPFSGGYVPHFSLWSCLFGILTATIATLIVHKIKHWSLGKTVLTWLLTFLIGYYVWTLIAWQLMFVGGRGLGLTDEQIYEVWQGSATATENSALQTFFLANVPVSFLWLLKKVGVHGF